MKRRDFIKGVLAVIVAPSLPLPEITEERLIKYKNRIFEISTRDNLGHVKQIYLTTKVNRTNHHSALLLDIDDYKNRNFREQAFDALIKSQLRFIKRCS